MFFNSFFFLKVKIIFLKYLRFFFLGLEVKQIEYKLLNFIVFFLQLYYKILDLCFFLYLGFIFYQWSLESISYLFKFFLVYVVFLKVFVVISNDKLQMLFILCNL